MAKARMLHGKISVSTQVNELSPKAALLFTWLIPHADDEGRLLGDAKHIKGRVVPLQPWSIVKVEKLLQEIKVKELIYRWSENGKTYMEFPTWNDYQQIRSDRRKVSLFPTFMGKKQHVGIPNGNQVTTQYNEIESNDNLVQAKKSEDKSNASESHSYKETGKSAIPMEVVNPKDFTPQDAGQAAAKDTWQALEPHNPMAFTTTYMKWYRHGLPVDLFYQFKSEIQQDPSITKKGAVFNIKAEEYFNSKQKAV